MPKLPGSDRLSPPTPRERALMVRNHLVLVGAAVTDEMMDAVSNEVADGEALRFQMGQERMRARILALVARHEVFAGCEDLRRDIERLELERLPHEEGD